VPVAHSLILSGSDWNDLNGERIANDVRAATYNVTTEKAAYVADFEALSTYLHNNVPWTIASLPTIPFHIDDVNVLVQVDLDPGQELTEFRDLLAAMQVTRAAYALSLSNAETLYQTNTATLTGTGSPVGAVTPLSIGQTYIDTAGPTIYTSYGLTNTDWV